MSEILTNSIELNEQEKENFNKIITDDKKENFEFSQKDEQAYFKKGK